MRVGSARRQAAKSTPNAAMPAAGKQSGLFEARAQGLLTRTSLTPLRAPFRRARAPTGR
jgi:hypothetical protein